MNHAHREADPHEAAVAEHAAFTQVAFAGHSRAEDLTDPIGVAGRLGVAWALLKAAGLREGRLLAGYAGGGDLLAVRTWREAALGGVQVVLPFLDAAHEPPPELAEGATRLDGAAVRARARSPHLAQTRWIIGAADLVVVVWNGKAPRGSGGTADTVRLALQHGVPVLWIHPDADGLRLIQPAYLPEDCGFGELVDMLARGQAPLVVDATAPAVRRALAEIGLLDAAPAETPAPAGAARLAWPWRAYAGFRRLLGGAPAPSPRPTPPPDLAEQAGFQLITEARAAAAREAQKLGAIHRSKQVILLAIAIAMATAGSASAMWPQIKVFLVSAELVLAVTAYLVWRSSEQASQHLRWGAARKTAEDLRLERIAWAVGVSTVPHDPLSTNAGAARQARRLAGLPIGDFDAARVQSWGRWVVAELLEGQAGYHREQARINGRISHRLHQAENVSFAVLLLLLVAFLIVALGLSHEFGHAPKWLSGLVMMAGAIVPAIGAACLALEATLSIEEQAHRSANLERQLSALRADLGDAWSLEDLQSVARSAIKLQRAQEEQWSEDVGRRRLFRGG